VIRFVFAFLMVVAIVLGGLMALRRNSRLGQPSQDVIDRAKVREREIEARERADGDE
jgi:hypothetical protein